MLQTSHDTYMYNLLYDYIFNILGGTFLTPPIFDEKSPIFAYFGTFHRLFPKKKLPEIRVLVFIFKLLVDLLRYVYGI